MKGVKVVHIPDKVYWFQICSFWNLLLLERIFYQNSSKRAIKEKNPNRGVGWGHGISGGIEERTCGNSRGQLKKKWNFQGCTRTNHVISMGLGFLPWNFQEVSHNFAEFPEVKGWNFLGQSDKTKISIRREGRGVRKVYPQPPCMDFSWDSPTLSILFAILTIDDMQDDAPDILRFLLKYYEMVKIETKTLFFAHFVSFLVEALLHPMNYTPRFC